MGNYIERVFPFLNVRFIAVTDDFDSFRPGTDLMMPLKNIVNEFYAKDISKKVSTAHRRKWTTDEYMCGFAPYGYLKSKTEKNRIVVDEATAGNVRLNETRDFDCRDLCRSRCAGSRWNFVRCEINPFLR